MYRTGLWTLWERERVGRKKKKNILLVIYPKFLVGKYGYICLFA